MAGIDDKIAATAFTAATSLTFDEVLTAADAAAYKADGITDRLTRTSSGDGRITYSLKRAKLSTIGDCEVCYAVGADGTASVSFVPGNYVKSRPTILMVIPSGPWGSVALKPFMRFSAALRQQVGA